MELNVTVVQAAVHRFLREHAAWDGNENTTPYLYLEDEETTFECEAYPLRKDAILVGIPLQNFLVVLSKPNNDPYKVWFALIKTNDGSWAQGRYSKSLTFDESMELYETQKHSALLAVLSAS